MADRGQGSEREDAGSGDPHRDLAGVLHDVSNALTVLLGWVSEARAPDVAPDAAAYALEVIEQRARIARDLARQAIGGPRVDEQCPIGALARDVAGALRVEAAHAGVTLAVKGGDVAATVTGAQDVSQVLTNLALNAIAYAPKGTEVTLDVTVDGDRCAVVVSDRGPGVPPALRDGIFHGESLRPGGTGVGLRHSRALARVRGGEVELLPPAPGVGARFRMSWPRVDSIPRRPSTLPRARELQGRRVLLIEDDLAVIQLLETALEGRGASVTIAGSRAELDSALGSAPFDSALLDLSPISEDVAGAIARLRAASPGIDLVLITGSADRLPEGVAGEMLKLVRKPFELGEVFSALSKKPPG